MQITERTMDYSRREALKKIGMATAGLAVSGTVKALDSESKLPFYQISLAQWSLHRAYYGKSFGRPDFRKLLTTNPAAVLQGDIDPINFPLLAKREFGISAIEYVNNFYLSKGTDQKYWKEMKSRCDGEGVKSILIMCNLEGNLGDPDEQARLKAVHNHHKWIDIAAVLGCHSIRVNAEGTGTMNDLKSAVVDGLGKLTDYGAAHRINVIVENHGGYSSDGKWLSEVIRQVDSKYCGTLPDFGNFCIEKVKDQCLKQYDRYQGIAELLPFAKGLSAKSEEFSENGEEKNCDFGMIMKLARKSGFAGYVGIEYAGKTLSEPDGIMATRKLLEKVGCRV